MFRIARSGLRVRSQGQSSTVSTNSSYVACRIVCNAIHTCATKPTSSLNRSSSAPALPPEVAAVDVPAPLADVVIPCSMMVRRAL
jgi:hypothetical protein